MGIDANILIKYRSPHQPTKEWLNDLSWNLSAAVGPEQFYTESEGYEDEAEFEKAYDAWCNLPKEQRTLENCPSMVRRAVELCGKIKPGEYVVGNDTQSWHFDTPGRIYHQDGPDILAADPEEWLLTVNYTGRYYGPGYERGDLFTILKISAWFIANLGGCRVFYGGDSSGVCAVELTPAYVAYLISHWAGEHGRDYYTRSGECEFPGPKPCALCPSTGPRHQQYLWSGSVAGVSCMGCGKKFRTEDKGLTWRDVTDEKRY